MIKQRVALFALASTVLAVGCSTAAVPTASPPVASFAAAATPTATVTPTASPTSAPSPTPAPSRTPTSAIPTLGPELEPLEAGTYTVVNRLSGNEGQLPEILITVPDGWSNFGGWAVHTTGVPDGPTAVTFWDVHMIYGHPCQWQGTLVDPGPTVDDLAAALVEVPLRNATEPIPVTLDGYAGKYLEWSVPTDMVVPEEGSFVECDVDGGFHDFKSWTGRGWGSNRYQQGPGQVDRLWIIDLDGARLVIDAFYMPWATDEDREELTEVVESIRFER